jgi:mRNA interferase RelE/StbE
MHNLNITKSVDRFLKSLKPKQFRQILQTILRLRLDSDPHDSKQLVGNSDFKRVDIGEFRIIYRVEDDVVKIAVVGKRNDDEVYKKFKRLSL